MSCYVEYADPLDEGAALGVPESLACKLHRDRGPICQDDLKYCYLSLSG